MIPDPEYAHAPRERARIQETQPHRRLWPVGFAALCLAFLFVSPVHADSFDGAPPSPSEYWTPGAALSHTQETPGPGPALPPEKVLVPGRKYRLSELIDIAQRNHPQTRIAWEDARQAAIAVDMSKGVYYPVLSLAAIGLYERVPLPFPKIPLIDEKGYIDVDAGILTVEAALEWLLLDFGRRSQTVKAAKKNQIAANYAFNAQHQQLAFDVAKGFYALSALDAQAEAAQASLQDASIIAESAEALRERGMATVPQVLIAQQARAQAAFDLEKVLSEQSNARVALSESVGVPPSTDLRIDDLSGESLPEGISENVDQAVEKALEQRQDLKALQAGLSAAGAAVHAAKADFWPMILLRGNAGGAYNNFEVDDSSWGSVFQPQYGVAVALEWPVFKGFEDRSNICLAESRVSRMQSELVLSRDMAVREVWRAHSVANSALKRHKLAESLLATSQSAYDSTLASYQQGLATLPEVSTARAALAQARAALSETKAEALLALATLCFLTGDLGMPDAAPSGNPPAPKTEDNH